MGATRVFFATDTHGSSVCFRKFINAGKFYEAHVIILGGDITGKKVIPFVRQPDGSFKVNHLDREHVVKEGEQLEAFTRNITDMGYYPYMTDPEELERLAGDSAAQDAIFTRLMKQRIRESLEFAEERLEGTGIRCYVQPGNDDEFYIDELFGHGTNAVNPEGKVIQIDEHYTMISTGYGNVTPWRCPRDVPEEELGAIIDSMAGQVRDFEHSIFNFHCPPHEKYQPRLGLHGHIHESRGTQKLGRTVCLNPGSEYGEGVLRGVIVDIDKKGVKSVTFTSG
jgi:Icc-related predicted phosphoesterase